VLEVYALWCGVCGRRTRLRRDARNGSVLDDTYRIDAKLAAGGFGVVYRATHLRSGLELALKVLHADFAANDTIAARFRREARALANLHDAHTVVTFERGELRDGTLFIAMELLRGDTLLERFRASGPLPWRQVLEILRAACSSLGGIVHRDLKPANIHLGADDFVKVLDFGVAKVLPGSDLEEATELTLVGQTIGTLEYMTPEQLIGAVCTPRSDIYALGVVGFEMICGRRPFPDAANPASLITALLTESPPAPSSFAPVPEAVDRLLLRCLERDPAYRFANVVDLAAAIDRALDSISRPAVMQRCARVHDVAMPELDVPARGSAIDLMPAPRSRSRLVYLLAALAGVGATAAAWVLAG
jgi:serine/threonine protein kinase